MNGLLLVAALLAPRWEIGAGAGGAVIAEDVMLTMTPWAGLQSGRFAGAIQAPLRLDLAEGGLRDRDWDEAADFGRLVRFLRYGLSDREQDGLRVGALADVTLGEGTLVSGYNNGVDPDHYRVGGRATYHSEGFGIDLFSDQLLGSPVAGARVQWRPLDWVTAAATAAADFEFPTRLQGTVDEVATPRADTQVFAGYGLSVDARLPPVAGLATTVYTAVNQLDDSELGAHFGLRFDLKLGKVWRARVRAEASRLGARYDVAWFDAGYLIDRWRGKAALREGFESVWGGRGLVEVEYASALWVGAEYSDAAQAGRAGLTAWVRLPTDKFQLALWYRNRYPSETTGLLDPEDALAALAVTAHVDAWWWLNLTVARVWRVDTSVSAFRPYSEVALTLEGVFGQ